MNTQRKNLEGGFTLIEIAIVVVIIGLLLGGVLKGQEMIRSARSHNVITQSNGLKAAMLGFSDRYRALPGDYSRASVNIPDITPTSFDTDGITITTAGQEGNGDSYIGGSVPPTVTITAGVPGWTKRSGNNNTELALVWLHLGNSGYISGGFTGVSTAIDESSWSCPADVCMTNAYNGPMFIINDSQQSGQNATSDDAISHQILSGKLIPVEVISDIDNKTDDSEPGNGNFRVADLYTKACALDTAGNASEAGVYVAATKGVQDWAVLSGASCGGVYLF
jgi:prepilin-type N-terminal cleavage/methylation domain-containing protein